MSHAVSSGRKGLLRLRAPATPERIQEVVSQRRVSGDRILMNETVSSLYSVTDGLEIGDTFEICGLCESLWVTSDVLSVHNWGTGDYDGQYFGDAAGVPQVAYVGHDPPLYGVVAESLEAWLLSIYIEACVHGNIDAPSPTTEPFRTYRQSSIQSRPITPRDIDTI